MQLFNSDSNMAGIFRAYLTKPDSKNNKKRIYIPSIHTINPYEYEEGSQEWEDCLKLLPEARFSTPEPPVENLMCFIIFESGNIKYPVIIGFLGTELQQTKVIHTGGGSGSSNGGGTGENVNLPDGEIQEYSGEVSEIINYAKSFIGKINYSMDRRNEINTGGSYADCSSYVQHVFNHFGIEVGSYTGAQVNSGIAINNRNDILPGDLILMCASGTNFGAGGGSHVGIAIDKNSVIDCNAGYTPAVGIRTMDYFLNHKKYPDNAIRRVLST